MCVRGATRGGGGGVGGCCVKVAGGDTHLMGRASSEGGEKWEGRDWRASHTSYRNMGSPTNTVI